MKAVILREFGAIEGLEYGDLPDPVPGPNEVVVDVQACASNFVDLLVIGGKYQFLPRTPFVPGKGPAGIVAALGSATSGLAVGDRVLAMAEQGGYGEKVAVAANQCYRLPDAMSFTDAAAMSLVYDTAWFGLRERGRVRAGESVLILSASGGVGYAAMQLAKAMGARVLAGVSSPEKAEMVRAAGPDALIDLSAADLRESLRDQVRAATDGQGADVVLDMLGGDVFDAALRAVAWRGRVVVIGFAAGRIPTIKANYLLVKNIEVSGLQISDYRKRMPEMLQSCFREVFGFYEAGKVRPAPATVMALPEYREALEMIRDRRARGRVVLTCA